MSKELNVVQKWISKELYEAIVQYGKEKQIELIQKNKNLKSIPTITFQKASLLYIRSVKK